MGSRFLMGIRRSWWVFLLYGLLAIAFGVVLLLWPGHSVMALVMTFGVLSLADGAVSLVSAVRRELALPRWLLVAYAVASVGFGVVAAISGTFSSVSRMICAFVAVSVSLMRDVYVLGRSGRSMTIGSFSSLMSPG